MNIISELNVLASKLEDRGYLSLASDVDGASATFLKVAKELGGQGYWVQNGRCWAGCYRSKRASKPKTPAQEIWFECHEEYEKAIAGNSDSWNKYAGFKIVGDMQKFASALETKLAENNDIGQAVISIVSDQIRKLQSSVVSAAETMANVSNSTYAMQELSVKAAELSSAMMKEAWGFGGMGNVLAPTMNKLRGRGTSQNAGKFSNLESLLGQLSSTMKNYVKQKMDFEKVVQTGVQNKSIPPQLAQVFQKGLRPLSVQSIADMYKALENAKGPGDKLNNQQNQDAASALDQMTSGPQQPHPTETDEPSDPDNGTAAVTATPAGTEAVPATPAGTEAVPATPTPTPTPTPTEAVPSVNEEGTPLRVDEPAEEQHKEQNFLAELKKLSPQQFTSLEQQFNQAMDQAESMSSGRHAKRQIFNLQKKATRIAKRNADKPPLAETSRIYKDKKLKDKEEAEANAVKNTQEPMTANPGNPLANPAVEAPRVQNIESYMTRFESLTDQAAKQFVMKSLVPLLQQQKKVPQEQNQSQWADLAAKSTKKRVFKLG